MEYTLRAANVRCLFFSFRFLCSPLMKWCVCLSKGRAIVSLFFGSLLPFYQFGVCVHHLSHNQSNIGKVCTFFFFFTRLRFAFVFILFKSAELILTQLSNDCEPNEMFVSCVSILQLTSNFSDETSAACNRWTRMQKWLIYSTWHAEHWHSR